MASDTMHWEQWEHDSIRRAGRAEVREAGREVARRAHALAWQAYLASEFKSDWPHEDTNEESVKHAWSRLHLAVVLLLVAMQGQTEQKEADGNGGQ